MNLKQSFLITGILSLILLGSWELYWRSQGYYPTLNDEKALWAKQRANVETATKEDFIILGSSRAFFDIQVPVFETETGKKPIQLSSTGSSPLPTFHDIVHNTEFDGTIILGVSPGLFFSTTFPKASPWQRAQTKVNHYENRTYAQRFNYEVSIPLQKSFAFLSADEEEWDDGIDLKSLLRQVNIGNRPGKPRKPPFYYFGDVDLDRNMMMIPRTVNDTAFANSIMRVWHFFGAGAPPPDKEATTAFFLEDLKKFKARNGNLILVRLPSSGGVRMGENMGLPRAEFWDDLVAKAKVTSYHFEDYDTLKDLKCPEESHLSVKDATHLTIELVKMMKKDNAIANSNIN